MSKNGKPQRVILKFTDINQRKCETQQLQYQAQRDGLTGLYNKTAAVERIKNSIEAHRAGLAALFVVDVDDFKAINDTYGHERGDKALHRVAAVLQSFFAAADILGRIGGDEFVVYAQDVGSEAAALQKGNRLCEKLVCNLDGAAVTCSVGLAFLPRHGTSYAALFQKADEALYFAKEHGKNISAAAK